MSESSSIVLGVARVRQFNQNTTTMRAWRYLFVLLLMHDLSEQINDFDSLDKLSRHRSCFIRTWLNQFERNKLEYYSVLFGIFGLSFVVLSLCILIIILSINRNQIIQQIDCTIINITYTHVKLCESYRCQVFNYCIPYICISKLS